MREKPVVGQKLILCCLHRGANRYRDAVVTKVGRKYFEVSPVDYGRAIQFHLEDWGEVTEYSPSYLLYRDRGEIRSEIAHRLALSHLRKYFSTFGEVPATTPQLMQALEALGLRDEMRAELDEKLDALYEQLPEITDE